MVICLISNLSSKKQVKLDNRKRNLLLSKEPIKNHPIKINNTVVHGYAAITLLITMSIPKSK